MGKKFSILVFLLIFALLSIFYFVVISNLNSSVNTINDKYTDTINNHKTKNYDKCSNPNNVSKKCELENLSLFVCDYDYSHFFSDHITNGINGNIIIRNDTCTNDTTTNKTIYTIQIYNNNNFTNNSIYMITNLCPYNIINYYNNTNALDIINGSELLQNQNYSELYIFNKNSIQGLIGLNIINHTFDKCFSFFGICTKFNIYYFYQFIHHY